MNFFDGKKVVIATMHGKEKVISKLLKESFGVESFAPTHFDTDKFGTFTRDVKRAGDQLEAARALARAALKETGADIGVASEGSFSPHDYIPFLSSNFELVLLLDKESGIEIRGHARTSDTNHDQREVKSVEDALLFAKEIGFPEHGIIVRTSKTSKKMYKEIKDWEELKTISKKLLNGFFTKTIFLETDMRAHRNPKRMSAIEEATHDLIKNIQSVCPDCGTPGFTKVAPCKNALCAFCGEETSVPETFLYECQKCHKQEERKEENFVQPKDCAVCNP